MNDCQPIRSFFHHRLKNGLIGSWEKNPWKRRGLKKPVPLWTHSPMQGCFCWQHYECQRHEPWRRLVPLHHLKCSCTGDVRLEHVKTSKRCSTDHQHSWAVAFASFQPVRPAKNWCCGRGVERRIVCRPRFLFLLRHCLQIWHRRYPYWIDLTLRLAMIVVVRCLTFDQTCVYRLEKNC